MLLTAIVLAAGVSAAPIPPTAEPMPNLFRQPARCGPLHDDVARRVRTSLRDRPGFEYAVFRAVGGCCVPAPVGYHPDYLLPGHADAPQFRPADDRPEARPPG